MRAPAREPGPPSSFRPATRASRWEAALAFASNRSLRVPVTIGLKRMRVLLPSDWREWPAEKMRVVLAHELAHAWRHDPAISLVAALNKCIFWFHPLAWWLERRLAVLAEHAADDAGLAVSSDAGSYARVLLGVASRTEGQ